MSLLFSVNSMDCSTTGEFMPDGCREIRGERVPLDNIKRMACSIAVLLMVFSLSACGLGGPAHGPASNAAAVVDLGFTSFSPAEVVVAVGETVEWRNKSLITHTVTDDPKRAEQ